MRDMHRGSQCTISVTDALDADGGIFSRRNPLFHIPLRIGHTDETPVYVPSSVPNLKSSSLSTRAWTFQERLLSRRVLHMRKQLMHWECYECSASEVDPRSGERKEERHCRGLCFESGKCHKDRLSHLPSPVFASRVKYAD